MAIRAWSIDRASKAASTAFDCDSQRLIFQLLKRQLGNIELLKQVAKNVDFKFAPQVTHAKHKMVQNRTLTLCQLRSLKTTPGGERSEASPDSKSILATTAPPWSSSEQKSESPDNKKTQNDIDLYRLGSSREREAPAARKRRPLGR